QAVLGHETFDAVEMLQKIEMPPRTAIFAIRRELEPDLLLFAHDLLDLAVLDLAQGGRGNLAALALGACLFERRGAQQAADVVGAVGRLRSRHGFVLSSAISMRSYFQCDRKGRGCDLPATPRCASSNSGSAASARLGPS